MVYDIHVFAINSYKCTNKRNLVNHHYENVSRGRHWHAPPHARFLCGPVPPRPPPPAGVLHLQRVVYSIRPRAHNMRSPPTT